MNCPKCNEPIPSGDLFCMKCGTRVKEEKKQYNTFRLIKISIIVVILLLLGACAIIIPKRLAHVRNHKIDTAKKQIIMDYL